MSSIEKSDQKLEESHARREFLKRVAGAAATAPAVALLLSASTMPAAASVQYGDTTDQDGCGCGA